MWIRMCFSLRFENNFLYSGREADFENHCNSPKNSPVSVVIRAPCIGAEDALQEGIGKGDGSDKVALAGSHRFSRQDHVAEDDSDSVASDDSNDKDYLEDEESPPSDVEEPSRKPKRCRRENLYPGTDQPPRTGRDALNTPLPMAMEESDPLPIQGPLIV
jgi:hypothetical protein